MYYVVLLWSRDFFPPLYLDPRFRPLLLKFVHSAQAAEPATPPPFQPSEQFGATEPLGFFDPLGFTAVGDERGFRKLRVSEIKHGRVARLHFELRKTSELKLRSQNISN